ncbi:MAG: hypothetical protein IJS54_04790 [Desulfovibrio sp.]|nr:hypothetical protein [Desulfovibrio sp.]
MPVLHLALKDCSTVEVRVRGSVRLYTGCSDGDVARWDAAGVAVRPCDEEVDNEDLGAQEESSAEDGG